MRIIEFFCGIGGVAAAVGPEAEVVAAIDISREALDVYAFNFPHRTVARELETIPAATLREWNADLWWLSPPCQPYTCRGRQKDIDDPRARSFLALVERIGQVRPPLIALENVPAFASSRAHGRFRGVLDHCGYTVREQIACPTELGVPMQRRRFYLTAALKRRSRRRSLTPDPASAERVPRQLSRFVDEAADEDPGLVVDQGVVDRYREAIHVADRTDPKAVAHCFTSAYGRSYVRSGSYLKVAGGVRRFSPQEILRLMGFGRSFRLPPHIPRRKAWQLVGNSLSVDVVRHVLTPLVAAELANHGAGGFRPSLAEKGANMDRVEG